MQLDWYWDARRLLYRKLLWRELYLLLLVPQNRSIFNLCLPILALYRNYQCGVKKKKERYGAYRDRALTDLTNFIDKQ